MKQLDQRGKVVKTGGKKIRIEDVYKHGPPRVDAVAFWVERKATYMFYSKCMVYGCLSKENVVMSIRTPHKLVKQWDITNSVSIATMQYGDKTGALRKGEGVLCNQSCYVFLIFFCFFMCIILLYITYIINLLFFWFFNHHLKECLRYCNYLILSIS